MMYDDYFDFGKYNGQPVSDVPTNYLRWCIDECGCLEPRLHEAIRIELSHRRKRADTPANRQPPPPADWSGVIRQWHHEMARRFHPDCGGSHEAMKAVNEAAERLKQMLETAA